MDNGLNLHREPAILQDAEQDVVVMMIREGYPNAAVAGPRQGKLARNPGENHHPDFQSPKTRIDLEDENGCGPA